MACKPLSFGSLETSQPVFSQSDGNNTVPQESSSSTHTIGTNVLRSCAQCHTSSPTLNLCKRCEIVWYCSERCQKSAQAAHQVLCDYNIFIPKNHEIACLFKEPNGDVRPITQNEFKQRTHSNYVNSPIYTPRALNQFPMAIPCQAAKNCTFSKLVGLQHYGERIGYGIVALEDIPAQTEVCNYGGLVIPEDEWNKIPHSNREHAFAAQGGNFTFDPSVYASLGAFVNDGPPNCILLTYGNPRIYTAADSTQVVVPLDKRITTIREVKKGEHLTWDYLNQHPVKLLPYSLDRQTYANFLGKYSKCLNISILNKGAYGSKVFDFSHPDLVEAMEVEYILGTPYVLACLHLEFNLDPATSLKDFKTLPKELQKKFTNAELVLKGMVKLPPADKQKFLEIVNSISGLAFLQVCKSLANITPIPSAEDCAKFGRLHDRMTLLYNGSLHSNYWHGSEREDFKKMFERPEHQQKIQQVDEEARKLPQKLYDEYQKLKERAQNYI